MSQDPGILMLSSPTPECGRYTPGHDVHWIQALNSRKQGDPQPVAVAEVADDGRITLQDGRRFWNHDPARLRLLLARSSQRAELWPLHLLAVQSSEDPKAWRLFCLGDEPDPCPSPALTEIPGEALIAETLRRGGATANWERVEREALKAPLDRIHPPLSRSRPSRSPSTPSSSPSAR